MQGAVRESWCTEVTFRRELKDGKAPAAGISGARVGQVEGTASAKTLRQEQLDIFMEHGGGQGSQAGAGEGKRWETKASSQGRLRTCALLDTEMNLAVR